MSFRFSGFSEKSNRRSSRSHCTRKEADRTRITKRYRQSQRHYVMYEKESGDSSLRVLGYRNIWYRFSPAELNLYVPVSLNTMSLMHTSFMSCFGSQRAASFPSYEHDGPFSTCTEIHTEQYAMIKTCLGRDFFLKHPHPRLRAARGLIYLKEMDLPLFYEKVRELKSLRRRRLWRRIVQA